MKRGLLLVAGAGAIVAILGGITGSVVLITAGGVALIGGLVLLPWLDEDRTRGADGPDGES